VGKTSIHSFPVLTTGQAFLHSCLHFYRVGLVCGSGKKARLSGYNIIAESYTYFGLALVVTDNGNSS
jgi:hypothetical protein